METIFMNTKNYKRSKLHKIVLDLSKRLDLRRLDMSLFKTYLYITL